MDIATTDNSRAYKLHMWRARHKGLCRTCLKRWRGRIARFREYCED